MTQSRTVFRVCTLCEATCGIRVDVEGDRVVSIKGDPDDPFSQGYICPKATGMKGLHEDPDRLRAPMVKRADGTWEEVSWERAYEVAAAGLLGVKEKYGAESLATYLGNPSAHNLYAITYLPVLNRALGSQQRYSASTVDQFPKMVSAGLMFGESLTIPIPDIDRTDYLMILGANPLASNGSLLTAPNFKGRLRDIRKRGGKVLVIDPRRSETADAADEHVFIRPGTDAFLLMAMVRTMADEGLIDTGESGEYLNGMQAAVDASEPYTPEAVAERCGIDAETIRRITREFCAAERAACYGRIGTTAQEFGTIASWAVDVVNTLSGNLDREGGVLFPKAAAAVGVSESPGGTGVQLHRWQSRVEGHAEVYGELPASTMAKEIDTPGEGQVRGMITFAGNPVVSTPDAGRLDRALAGLDFMVSVDIYLNETTRHADVILPPTSALEHEHYDLLFYRLSVRNIAKYSPAVFEPAEGAQHDWEILATLSAHLMGFGAMTPAQVDDFVLGQVVEAAAGKETSGGLDAAAITEALGAEPGPARMLDLMIRTGPHGDRFGARPDGLTLDKVKASEHGIDLGALEPQLPNVLETPSAKVELAPELIMSDLPRLRAALDRETDEMLLIGRRHLRSNNSWCHNLEPLVKGRDRCTLLIHPGDADRLGLTPGQQALVKSSTGEVSVAVDVSDEVMPGVCSLPHGWGHDVEGVRMEVARRHAGVNSNILTDADAIDVPSGNAVLNGIPVTVAPA